MIDLSTEGRNGHRDTSVGQQTSVCIYWPIYQRRRGGRIDSLIPQQRDSCVPLRHVSSTWFLLLIKVRWLVPQFIINPFMQLLKLDFKDFMVHRRRLRWLEGVLLMLTNKLLSKGGINSILLLNKKIMMEVSRGPGYILSLWLQGQF